MRVSHLALATMLAGWPMLAAAQENAPPTAAPEPATAPADQDDAGAEEGEDIVVTGQRPPGSVPGDIPPEKVLSPADIRSYGVSSVGDLLAELGPQVTSGRGGQPVVLLNGRRISGFREIRDLPTEAILRVDILPEEVALKFGYRADQKVVNFVLRGRFRSVAVELADRIATDGGRNTPEGEVDLLNIRRATRLTLHGEYQRSSALTEDERNIPALSGNVGGIDQRPFRTLLSSSENFALNAVYARNVFGNVAGTINGSVERNSGSGLRGFPGVTLNVPAASPFATDGTAGTVSRSFGNPDYDALTQRNSSWTSHLGTTLNGDAGAWRWSLTGNYDRVDAETVSDGGIDSRGFQTRLDALDPTADPRGVFGPGDFGLLPANRGRSTSSTGGIDLLFAGTAFSLPAGPVATSIRAGASTSDFSSRTVRLEPTLPGDVSRDIVNAQANVDLPITSRSRDVLGGIGNLSLNFNAGLDHLSDFGTLTTFGYGLNWSPIVALRLIASASDENQAPSAQQIGDPQIATAGVRVFDFTNGTNAIVTRITGGNPGLRANDRHVDSLSATLKPWDAKDITFTANYTNTNVDDPIASFPGATGAIEDAFKQRFVRDLATGQLLQIDARSINFAASSRSQLRWGVNVSMPLKSSIQKQLEAFRAGTGPNPFAGLNGAGRRRGQEGRAAGDRPVAQGQGDAAQGTDAPRRPRGEGEGARGEGRRGEGGGGGGFGGGGRGGGQGGGRINFALYHTWHLTDRVTIADGGPTLDLLDGDTLGGGGGQPRHEFEAQAGYSNNGIGARLSANYASATQVRGGPTSSLGTLDFGSLATVNLRLFADPGQRLDLVRKHPWLRGLRVTLSLDNIANTRRRVTDASGATPFAYAPDYLDPLGRTVRLSVRKLFF